MTGKLVKAEPSIAGRDPDNLLELTVESLASATVPGKLPAGKLVKLAPDPLIVVAVAVPVMFTPPDVVAILALLL